MPAISSKGLKAEKEKELAIKIIGYLVYHTKVAKLMGSSSLRIDGDHYSLNKLLVDSFERINTSNDSKNKRARHATIRLSTFFKVPLVRELFQAYINSGLLKEALNSRNKSTIKVKRVPKSATQVNGKPASKGIGADQYKNYKFHSNLHVDKWIELLNGQGFNLIWSTSIHQQYEPEPEW